MHQTGLVQASSRLDADLSLKLLGLARGGLESEGDCQFSLIQISDVIDKGELLARVNEADGGRISGREDGGMDKPIETGVGGREGAIDGISGEPVLALVITTAPRDSCSLGSVGVGLADAYALLAAELLKCEARVDGFLAEACAVHTDDDTQTRPLIEREAGLTQEVAAMAASTHARGVETDAQFA